MEGAETHDGESITVELEETCNLVVGGCVLRVFLKFIPRYFSSAHSVPHLQ